MPVSGTARDCSCTDALDPNATPAQAVDLGNHVSPTTKSFSALKICTNVDDWFSVALADADKIVVDLTFTQGSFNQDLDVHFYKPDGTTDLTPCPPAASCMTSNGQGSSSNEHFEWTIPAGGAGKYYVVVRGYQGSTNTYAIAAK